MKNERGVVALLVTIIISLLLVLIATATVAIMISELQQASDTAQSARAYYAAEAGAEDAIIQIENAVNGAVPPTNPTIPTTGCVAQSPMFATNYGYTCQKISPIQNGLEGRLKKDSVADFYMMGESFGKLTINWNLQSENPAPFAGGVGTYSAPVVGVNWPNGNPWNFPAVMEIELVTMKVGDNTPINTKFIEVMPGTSSSAVDVGSITTHTVDGDCDSNAQYNCQMVLTFNNAGWKTGPSGDVDYLIRIIPRFASADYKLTFDNNVTLNAALIDVTGRANDVYRRVTYIIKYAAGKILTTSPTDYHNFTNDNICGTIHNNPPFKPVKDTTKTPEGAYGSPTPSPPPAPQNC